MQRISELNTGRYATAFPKNGKLHFVINSDLHCETLEKAKTFLYDRVANGEAFDHEVVVELWLWVNWDGLATATQTDGKREKAGVYGWLFPKQIS